MRNQSYAAGNKLSFAKMALTPNLRSLLRCNIGDLDILILSDFVHPCFTTFQPNRSILRTFMVSECQEENISHPLLCLRREHKNLPSCAGHWIFLHLQPHLYFKSLVFKMLVWKFLKLGLSINVHTVQRVMILQTALENMQRMRMTWHLGFVETANWCSLPTRKNQIMSKNFTTEPKTNLIFQTVSHRRFLPLCKRYILGKHRSPIIYLQQPQKIRKVVMKIHSLML